METLKADSVVIDESTLLGLLMALLDRIEVEEDASLASQRFDILRQYGEVEITGMLVSSKLN